MPRRYIKNSSMHMLMDFHFCTSEINGDLDTMCPVENSAHLARPYLYQAVPFSDIYTAQSFEEMAKKLAQFLF